MIKHLAVIMDGNRRWAQARGMKGMFGHQEGAKAVDRTVQFCLESDIPYLSLYAFSLENLQRSPEEKEFIFNLMVTQLEQKIDEFVAKDIRIKFVGDRTIFPQQVMPTCRKLEQATEHCSKLVLNFLFCYGARQEIMEGVRKLVRKVKSGEIAESELDEKDFEQCLWSAGTPVPDLIIRTGGRQRLSNFLLYQAAYSEFCFLDCLWPDITLDDFKHVVHDFENSTRNFGV